MSEKRVINDLDMLKDKETYPTNQLLAILLARCLIDKDMDLIRKVEEGFVKIHSIIHKELKDE